MQIREALKFAIVQLSNSSTPSLDARLLLGFAMNMTYEQLLLNYDQSLSQIAEDEFLKLIDRRQNMEPIAYILGKQEFYGLELIVNDAVLIPRPDTELLIDVMLDQCSSSMSEEVTILELGTGSGAIAIALAHSIITAAITALDISDAALEIARINAKTHNVVEQIKFIQSDWYQNLGSEKYDYIISNPPYIAYEEQEHMSEATRRFEPELALYAADNGLVNYKTIIASASKYLKPKGKLLLEIGYLQKEMLFEILQQHDFNTYKVHTDLAGRDRVIVATRETCC
ncbi:MAG: peptide chain release factor N(5)-glutamine methyltransferase [Rickettsiaceae bacterium]|nr:peptide chain release factor N(5)-glutamine methyltransferase [Rickettsiaceae bacterium]